MYKRSQECFHYLNSDLIGNRICHVYFINSEDFFCPVRGISLFKMSFIFADTDFISFFVLYTKCFSSVYVFASPFWCHFNCAVYLIIISFKHIKHQDRIWYYLQ